MTPPHLCGHAWQRSACIEKALQAGASAIGGREVLLLLLLVVMLPQLLLLTCQLLLPAQLGLLLLQLRQLQLKLQRLHVVHVAPLHAMPLIQRSYPACSLELGP